MLGMYFAHVISLILYITAIVISVCNIKKAFTIPQPLRKLVIAYITFAIMTCSIFIALQLDWILQDHNDAVGDTTAMWWLVFDYLNGMAYISGMVALGVGIDIYNVIMERLYKSQCPVGKDIK